MKERFTGQEKYGNSGWKMPSRRVEKTNSG